MGSEGEGWTGRKSLNGLWKKPISMDCWLSITNTGIPSCTHTTIKSTLNIREKWLEWPGAREEGCEGKGSRLFTVRVAGQSIPTPGVHASPDAPAMDIRVDGGVIQRRLAFGHGVMVPMIRCSPRVRRGRPEGFTLPPPFRIEVGRGWDRTHPVR